jgi:flagellar hook protein FlgE
MASFFIPLTGLQADSTALNTIANNLSNMSTTAYKAQTTNFSDLFYQHVGTSGSGDQIQVGSGVQVAANSTNFSTGSSVTSGTTASDVELNGNGFFVVNDGTSNLYTRNGAFTQDKSGHLVTSDGLNVMGYQATKGVVNTSTALSPITIPLVGQVEAPEATTSFSMTANLDSTAAIGTSFPATMTVYDSQGVGYQASVTYTKTATNVWSYNIALPDTLTSAATTAATATVMPVPSVAGTASTETLAAAATAGTASTLTSTLTPTTSAASTLVSTLTPASTVSGANTLYSYNFGTGGAGDASTTLDIGGTAVSVTPGESVSALAAQITGLGVAGVSASATGNVLTITAPTATTLSGSLVGDLSVTSDAYSFTPTGTVDPTSTMTISGQDATGASFTTVAPVFTAGETITQYATALTNALSAKGITNVTVTPNTTTNTLSISGADMTVANNVVQGLAATTTNITLNTGGTVDSSTNLTITGLTAAGTTATITAPTITTGETLAQYAAALTTALGPTGANLANVSVSTAGNVLSITGANMTIANGVTQDLPTTVTNYDFGTTATVDPATNFTLTGQNAAGTSLTITAPTITTGETVAQYQAALTSALSTVAGGPIVGVTVSSTGGQLTITGANVTTANSMKQDLSASTVNYSFGTNSSGVVATVDPSTNLTITGLTSTGTTSTIVAPTVTAGESLATYVADLNTALATAGIGGVTVTSTAAGVLSITGANMSASGKVIQDAVGSANTSGTLTFNSSGTLVSPAADVTGISYAGLSDGAANLNITWDILGTSGSPTISQVDTASAASSAIANGYAAGTYESFSISSDGTVTASYTNGQNTAIGQLALANVANLQGLEAQGNSEYATTLASGVATVGVSGTDGLGTMTGSALEASNVNISAEFSELIIAQRAFEANAKSITTFDTVTSDTINMVH